MEVWFLRSTAVHAAEKLGALKGTALAADGILCRRKTAAFFFLHLCRLFPAKGAQYFLCCSIVATGSRSMPFFRQPPESRLGELNATPLKFKYSVRL
jgi:hypothetical protein